MRIFKSNHELRFSCNSSETVEKTPKVSVLVIYACHSFFAFKLCIFISFFNPIIQIKERLTDTGSILFVIIFKTVESYIKAPVKEC